MNTQHVVPVNDHVDHDTSTEEANCICGPDLEVLEGDNKVIGQLIIHHSLDGREM